MKTPHRMGTCYTDVYRYFCYENEIPDALLVHGVLHGRDDLTGWIYGHAWIEIGDIVMQPVKQKDNGKTYGLAFVARKESFYELYKVENVKRYTKDQVLEVALEHKHMGPWHELGLGDTGYQFRDFQLCEGCNTMKNCINGFCGRCKNNGGQNP